MRIQSGATDRYIYFVAVDATDLKTRETALTGFAVRRSRNGGLSAAMDVPTVHETDQSNMPGVYELLLDEDTTIAAANDAEEMVLHITKAGMAPVTRVVELYRPETTAGRTLTLESDGVGHADVKEVLGDATSATDLKDFADAGYDPATNKVQGVVLADTVTTYTGNTVQTGDSFSRLGAAAGASVSADVAAVKVDSAAILVDTGTTLDAHMTDIKGTGFVKDTHSLIDIETYVDLIDDGTSGLAKIATDVAAALVDTTALNDVKIPNTISLANINAEVDTALADIHLDHLLATNYDPADKPGAVTALLNELVESDGGVSRLTANALEQAAGSTGLSKLTSGTARAGTISTITLATSHPDDVDFFYLARIILTGGAGAGQSRLIVGYTALRVATVNRDWTTAPGEGTTYEIQGADGMTMPIGAGTASE